MNANLVTCIRRLTAWCSVYRQKKESLMSVRWPGTSSSSDALGSLSLFTGTRRIFYSCPSLMAFHPAGAVRTFGQLPYLLEREKKNLISKGVYKWPNATTNLSDHGKESCTKESKDAASGLTGRIVVRHLIHRRENRIWRVAIFRGNPLTV